MLIFQEVQLGSLTPATAPCCQRLRIGNSSICIGINYSVLNKTKRYEWWPNTEDFRLVNYSFNTGTIHSTIGQIVTEFYQIFQHLNE